MIAFRPADVVDRPDNTELRFITDAWARSFRKSTTAGFIADERWYAVMLPELKRALATPGVRTVVAYDPAEPDYDLYGFAAGLPSGTPPLVYYAYVKDAYRRRGFGRALVRALGIHPDRRLDYACRTPATDDASGWFRTKFPLARWASIRARNAPIIDRRTT